MITRYYRNLRDKKVRILDEEKPGSWIHVESPTEQDVDDLVARYHLEKDLLMDATDQYEVPRMEIEEGIIYIFSRYPHPMGSQITTSPILFILTEKQLISVARNQFPLLESFISRNIYFTTQKTKLFLQLFQLINTSYDSYTHSISRETRSSSHNLEKVSNKEIAQFVNYERILNDFHLALVRTNAVLNNLLTNKYLKLYEEDRDLIEDLFLNNDQLIQLTNENLKSIVNIRDAYSTIMTHNTNRVVRLFTSVTVLLTIPTIIASIYGMNVHLPFEQHPNAFSFVMLAILIFLVGFTFMFIKNDWL